MTYPELMQLNSHFCDSVKETWPTLATSRSRRESIKLSAPFRGPLPWADDGLRLGHGVDPCSDEEFESLM